MRNYIQTDIVRISAIYLRTGGTPEIAHYATEWMVTVIPFITSSGEVGKKRGFTSKLGYLYPSSSQESMMPLSVRSVSKKRYALNFSR